MDPGLDFSSLLGLAEHVSKDKASNEVRLLKTKFGGPKKEKKKQEGKLSVNVQRFLAKKEQEEKEKEKEKREQVKNLQELRTDRAKNKIRKHLKVTKSSNKAAISEAENRRDTAVTMTGRKQCDEDDYGFASNESNKLYEKLMGKYEATPDDPMAKFSKAKPKTHVDISSAMERVKLALKKEEEPVKHTRNRKRKHGLEGSGSRREADEDGVSYTRDNKDHKKDARRDEKFDKYGRDKDKDKDKEAPKSKKERDREKEEAAARRRKQAKHAPKTMDFQALMQMAKTVKDKPIVPVKPKKEIKESDFGDRPMTKKQRDEYIRENEARLRREGKLSSIKQPPPPSSSKKPSTERKDDRDRPKVEDDRQKIPKIRKPEPGPELHAAVKKSLPPPSARRPEVRKPEPEMRKSESATSNKNGRKGSNELSKMNEEYKRMQAQMKEMEERLKMQEETRKLQEKMREMESKLAASSRASSSDKSSKSNDRKSSDNRKRDIRDVQPRSFPGEKSRKEKAPKRPQRIESDSEYDSEMDDFIDDGGEGGYDISKEIKSIFGYDRNRYRDEPDFDDRSMENNRYSSIMQEEVRSAKIGRMEDLEDMRREEAEKKRKKRR